jgi:hypothetical protein
MEQRGSCKLTLKIDNGTIVPKEILILLDCGKYCTNPREILIVLDGYKLKYVQILIKLNLLDA